MTETQVAPKPLWGGKKLPVIGVTGEYGSGKTLFLLTIDPDCFDKSTPPRTIAWGTEDGLTPYEDSFAFEHRNLTQTMLRPGYKPEHLYLEWLGQMRSIHAGQFRVGCIDTVSEIEEGLQDWVRQHPEHFDHTRGQYSKMEGLYWGDVKALWKQHLSEAAARFETLAFSSHTKAIWRGSEPTKEKTAKGKQTLWELASLYLWLDRAPEPGSKKAPMKPAGTIFQGKNRLVRYDAASGELVPILPPRLPEATPDAIRGYISEPANYRNLKADERAEAEKPLSDDDKLMVQAGIAQNQAVAAQAELSRVELMRQAAQAQAAAMQQPPLKHSATEILPTAPPDTGNGTYSASTTTAGSIEPDQRQQIVALFQHLNISQEDAKAIIAKRGCEKLAQMSYHQATELLGKLKAKAMEGGDCPF